MLRKVFYLLLLSLFCIDLTGQWYYTSVLPNLSDQALLDGLVDNYKPNNVLDYGAARDVLYSEIYNVNDTVSGIYTDHQLYLDPTAQPREFLFMNGEANGINCEHSYPRSKGADNGNGRSDMHHLFPSRVFVNNARGSKPFGEIQDQLTDDWFYQEFQQGNIPGSSQIDLYSENTSSQFEPRESVKGNVARAIMYFYTMYQDEADAADPNFFEAQKETLCQWHFLDPIDSLEYFRSLDIAEYQEDKANPFVLDCSVATRTFCGTITSVACDNTVSTNEPTQLLEFQLFPNPSSSSFDLSFAERHKKVNLEILNLMGQQLMNLSFVEQQNIHVIHKLPSGSYFSKISIEGAIRIEKFVVY